MAKTVYFINGFLEGGKTTFISELMKKEYFRIEGSTLLIVCEEGDTDYREEDIKESDTVIEYIEDKENFTEEYITSLEKKHRPERIIVEYNGMWDRKNLEFPWYWEEIVEVAVYDASTFKLYADNMRSILAEQVRRAGIVVFNRCDGVREKLGSYTRNIKAINRNVNFVFRGKDGDILLDPDETLPYDITSDELDLDDEGFAVFCIDSMERTEIYDGKKISFNARAYKLKTDDDFEFVSGRYVMTCCEADMTFVGIICSYYKAYELENKEWIRVNGMVRIAYDEEMKRNVPVCRVIDVERINPPKDELISLI